MHKAAKSSAKAHGKKPYEDLVSHLESGDLDLKVNTLTLLNILLQKVVACVLVYVE